MPLKPQPPLLPSSAEDPEVGPSVLPPPSFPHSRGFQHLPGISSALSIHSRRHSLQAATTASPPPFQGSLFLKSLREPTDGRDPGLLARGACCNHAIQLGSLFPLKFLRLLNSTPQRNQSTPGDISTEVLSSNLEAQVQPSGLTWR